MEKQVLLNFTNNVQTIWGNVSRVSVLNSLSYETELALTRAGINILNVTYDNENNHLADIFYEFQYSTTSGGVKWSRQVYHVEEADVYFLNSVLVHMNDYREVLEDWDQLDHAIKKLYEALSSVNADNNKKEVEEARRELIEVIVVNNPSLEQSVKKMDDKELLSFANRMRKIDNSYMNIDEAAFAIIAKVSKVRQAMLNGVAE